MATYRQELEYLIGSVADVASLPELALQEARKTALLVPPSLLFMYGTRETISNGSGVNVQDNLVLEVTRAGYGCTHVSSGVRGFLSDASSLYYATYRTPFYYVRRLTHEINSLYIEPAPTSSEVGEVVLYQLLLSFDVERSVDRYYYPAEITPALLFALAASVLVQRAEAIRLTLPALVYETLVLPAWSRLASAPVLPALPSFTYTPASASSGSAPQIAALPTSPTYTGQTKPTVPSITTIAAPGAKPSAPSAPVLDAVDFTKDVLGNSIVYPSAPAAPSISYVDAAAVAPSVVTIGSLGSAPSLTYSNYVIDLTDFTSAFNSDHLIRASQALDREVGKMEFETHNVNRLIRSHESAWNEWQQGVAKIIQQANIARSEAEQTARQATDVAVVNKAKQLEAALAQYVQTLEKYQTDLATVVEKIKAKGETHIAKNSLVVQLFAAQSQMFSAEVAAFESYERIKQSATGLDNEQKISLLAAETARFQAAVQDAVAAYDAQRVVFEAGVQKVITQAQIDAEIVVLNANNTTGVNLQNAAKAYERFVAEYAASIERASLDHQRFAQELSQEVSVFSLQVQGEIQEYQTRQAARIADFQGTTAQKQGQIEILFQESALFRARYDEEIKRLGGGSS